MLQQHACEEVSKGVYLPRHRALDFGALLGAVTAVVLVFRLHEPRESGAIPGSEKNVLPRQKFLV